MFLSHPKTAGKESELNMSALHTDSDQAPAIAAERSW
jgi:hypothetical protein